MAYLDNWSYVSRPNEWPSSIRPFGEAFYKRENATLQSALTRFDMSEIGSTNLNTSPAIYLAEPNKAGGKLVARGLGPSGWFRLQKQIYGEPGKPGLLNR